MPRQTISASTPPKSRKILAAIESQPNPNQTQKPENPCHDLPKKLFHRFHLSKSLENALFNYFYKQKLHVQDVLAAMPFRIIFLFKKKQKHELFEIPENSSLEWKSFNTFPYHVQGSTFVRRSGTQIALVLQIVPMFPSTLLAGIVVETVEAGGRKNANICRYVISAIVPGSNLALVLLLASLPPSWPLLPPLSSWPLADQASATVGAGFRRLRWLVGGRPRER